MNSNDANDLSGFSREELLHLVAAQQSQLRTQQQLSLLEQAQRLNTTNSLFQLPQAYGCAGGSSNIAALFAARGAPTELSALTGASAAGGGLADLLLRRGVSAELHDPSSSAAGLLTAQAAQDPFGATMRQLMLRQELLSGSGAAFGPAATGGSALPTPGFAEDMMLRRLMASSEAQAAATMATNDASQRLGGGAPQGALLRERLLGASGQARVTTSSSGQDPPTAAEQETTSKTRSILDARPAAKSVPAAHKKKTKRPLSAYNIFFKEEHAKIIAQNEKEKAEKRARGEPVVLSDDEYSIEEDANGNKTGKKRKRSLSTNQPGKRGKRQVDFENLTKVIGKRWKELPKERIDEYKRRAEEAMQAYRKNLFQKIRNSVKEDQC